MEKRVTIYDIAKKLNISTTTVYRALNNKPKVSPETCRMVFKTAQEMGFKANTLARSLARRQIKMAVFAFTSFPGFHSSFIQGASDTHDELRDYNIKVDYFSYDEGDCNSPKGDAFLESTIEKIAYGGYDGALICTKYTGKLKLLKENNVCVATAINDVDKSLRKFCIQYNGRVAGRIAAELLWWRMDRNKTVAIASGYAEEGIHTETVDGFFEQLRYTPLALATVYYNHDDPQRAYTETNRVIEEHKGLGAIYVNSYNSAGVIRSIREHGLSGEIRLVTSDIYPGLVDALNDGTVIASIFQDQYSQGRMGLRYLYQTIAEGLKTEDTIRVKPQIVMRSNVELFL
jgi:LacI family transcriptional regulator